MLAVEGLCRAPGVPPLGPVHGPVPRTHGSTHRWRDEVRSSAPRPQRKRARPCWRTAAEEERSRVAGVEVFVDVVRSHDQEGRHRRGAVQDAGALQRVALKPEHVDLVADACRHKHARPSEAQASEPLHVPPTGSHTCGRASRPASQNLPPHHLAAWGWRAWWPRRCGTATPPCASANGVAHAQVNALGCTHVRHTQHARSRPKAGQAGWIPHAREERPELLLCKSSAACLQGGTRAEEARRLFSHLELMVSALVTTGTSGTWRPISYMTLRSRARMLRQHGEAAATRRGEGT